MYAHVTLRTGQVLACESSALLSRLQHVSQHQRANMSPQPVMTIYNMAADAASHHLRIPISKSTMSVGGFQP